MENLPSADQLAILYECPDEWIYGGARAVFSVMQPLSDGFRNTAIEMFPAAHDLITEYVERHANKHYFHRLPLMDPYDVILCAVMYLCMIALLYPIGQAVGKCQLRVFGMLHNLFLYALSFYMMSGIAITAVASGYSLWNNGVQGPESRHGWRMAKLIWIFYVSKLPEFVDTVIMMLKQNYRQVSFLHLYHHCTIFVIWYIVTLEAPGGEAYWSAMVNSGIHVIMYGYYFGTSVFTKGPIRSALNSLKFFITKGQMTQFALNCVQALNDLYIVRQPPNYPSHLTHLLFWYMLTLLALFYNFFGKNQGKVTKSAADKKKV